jgi:TolB-like protein
MVAVIQRCLARERRERYQSARELKAALEAARESLSSGRQMITDPGPKRQIGSLAVLPLLNRCAEPGQEFFVDGMTDALIAELSRMHALRVISRTSVMRYRDTTKSVPQIAAELGVDALVEGSVVSSRGIVRVQVQLIDAAADRSIWSRTYDRPADDILALHSDVARAVTDDIRVRLSPEERARLDEVRHVDPAAHELWLKGRYLQNKAVWTPADYEQALEFYKQSAERDPNYAPAWVGQADIYHRLGGYGIWPPKKAFAGGKVAAERALELDSSLADAHSAVAFSRWLNDWNYTGALEEYERALALGSQQAIHESGSLLSLLHRHEEAVARFL